MYMYIYMFLHISTQAIYTRMDDARVVFAHVFVCVLRMRMYAYHMRV
jgi:hypothetical protein